MAEVSGTTNRLTLSDDIQLFFRQGGVAWYSSKSGTQPEQIEAIVYEWQDCNLSHPQFDFSEKWLQTFEAPDSRKEEMLRELRRAYNTFREHMTRTLLALGVPRHIADKRVTKMAGVVIRQHNPEMLPDSDTEE